MLNESLRLILFNIQKAGIPPEQKSNLVLNDIHEYLIWLEL